MTAVVALGVVLIGVAPRAVADPMNPCPPDDVNCVSVGVGSPGGPGGGGGGGHHGGGGGGGGPSKPDPCSGDTGYSYSACSSGGVAGLAICVPLYSQYSGTLSLADLNAMLTKNGCPAVPAAAAPPPSPAGLALRAAASFDLKNPSGHRSPPEGLDWHGYSLTYLGLWTFYWTDGPTWVTKTGRRGVTSRWGTRSSRRI